MTSIHYQRSTTLLHYERLPRKWQSDFLSHISPALCTQGTSQTPWTSTLLQLAYTSSSIAFNTKSGTAYTSCWKSRERLLPWYSRCQLPKKNSAAQLSCNSSLTTTTTRSLYNTWSRTGLAKNSLSHHKIKGNVPDDEIHSARIEKLTIYSVKMILYTDIHRSMLPLARRRFTASSTAVCLCQKAPVKSGRFINGLHFLDYVKNKDTSEPYKNFCFNIQSFKNEQIILTNAPIFSRDSYHLVLLVALTYYKLDFKDCDICQAFA